MNGKPITGDDAEALMGTVRNPAELAEMWKSWHDNVGAPMRQDYTRMVEIANQGAKELGYADTGAMWRSQYDMTPEEFSAMYERLWSEVKPLYDAAALLHADQAQPEIWRRGPARDRPDPRRPARQHVGAGMGQHLRRRRARRAPATSATTSPTCSKAKKYDAERDGQDRRGLLHLARASRRCPRPSGSARMITQPARPRSGLPRLGLGRRQQGRPAHQDVHQGQRRRLRHHPPRARPQLLPARLQPAALSSISNGANDGFHEAIGDFIALSVTPEYLVQIGLLDRDKVPAADKDIGLLLRQAMDKVAFLPFGLLVDKWRWGVFDGSITPANYNQAWVDLKQQYQGIVPPVRAQRGRFRSGRQVSTSPATRPMRATSSRGSCSSSSTRRPATGRLEGAAAPLQLLRQQGSRRSG